MDEKPPPAFVPLTSLRPGPREAADILAEIRQIYFKTTAGSIEHDFAHAIELLKSLPDEETREKAHVYMEGLAEMRKEFAKSKVKGQRSKGRSKVKVKGKGGREKV